MTSLFNHKLILSVVAVAFCIFSVSGCSDMNSADDTEDALNYSLNSQANGFNNANVAAVHTYEITIENISDGQPFSPGVLVTHTEQASVWTQGESASDLIINIAEDGLGPDNLPVGVTPADLINNLRQSEGVYQVVETGAPIDDNTPPILDGAPNPPSSRTFTIEAAANANRLSIAIMAICTNDGFTGLDSVNLPGGFKPAVYHTAVYDAGSEPNTEQYSDIPDPCQVVGPDTGPPAIPNGNDTPEGDVGIIQHHPGISGIAVDTGLDPELHGWDQYVAKITVQRIK